MSEKPAQAEYGTARKLKWQASDRAYARIDISSLRRIILKESAPPRSPSPPRAYESLRRNAGDLLWLLL